MQKKMRTRHSSLPLRKSRCTMAWFLRRVIIITSKNEHNNRSAFCTCTYQAEKKEVFEEEEEVRYNGFVVAIVCNCNFIELKKDFA